MTTHLRRSPKRATLPFWAFGLVGGVALSLLTIGKLLVALVTGQPNPAFGQALALLALVFAMGFVCGVVAWTGRHLHRRIGWVGDSIVGIGVAVVLFTMCILVFEPALDEGKLGKIGLPLCIAVSIGAVCGPWFARDLRKLEP